MDRDFFNTIQPDPNCPSIPPFWSNETIPSWRESLVMPSLINLHFNSPYAIPASKICGDVDLSDCIGSIKGVCAVDPHTVGVTQFDYLENSPADLIFGNDGLASTIFTEDENPHWYIADAGVSCKSLRKYHNLTDFYTTPEVANETERNLLYRLPSDNICLQSFTLDYFKEHGNVVTATSPFGETNTISFMAENNSTTWLNCGHIIGGYLTEYTTGERVTVCVDLLYNSTNDLSIAVNGLAFYTGCSIATEDSCLGHAFSRFHSFSSDNTFWRNKL